MAMFSEVDLELGTSLQDLASVRVLLLPVGHISQERFDELAALVSATSRIPLRSLPRRIAEDADSSTPSKMPSRISSLAKSRKVASIDSQMTSRSLTGDGGSPEYEPEDSVCLRYEKLERDASGEVIVPTESEWEEYRASLSVWGAIGIFDHNSAVAVDSTKDALKLYKRTFEEFASIVSQCRSLSSSKCFVFIPPDSVSKPGVNLLSDTDTLQGAGIGDASRGDVFGVIPYAPENSQEGVKMEIRAQVLHVADLILQSLNNRIRTYKQTSGPILSPLDMKHSVEKHSTLKQRRQGRLDKCFGDLYLLMALPALARTKYESAIDKTKTNGDRLWLAGSLEGYNAAALSTGDFTRENVDAVLKKSTEILKLYKRKRLFELEVAAAMKIATFLSRLPKKRRETLHYAKYAAEAGVLLKPVKKRIALHSQLVKLMMDVNAHRKAALFLYQLAGFYSFSRKWHESYDIIMEVIKLVGESSPSSDGWEPLRRLLFTEAEASASKVFDQKRQSYCLVNALSLSAPSGAVRESDRKIINLLNQLDEPPLEISDSLIARLVGFSSVETTKNASVLRDRSLGKTSSRSGPFIFSAIGDSKNSESTPAQWIKEEIVNLPVTLESKLGTALEIRIVGVTFSIREDELGSPTSDDRSGRIPLSEEIRHSSSILRVNPQYVRLPERKTSRVSTRTEYSLQCTPLQKGSYEIGGLAAVLFGNCLIKLKLKSNCRSRFVKVVPPLPRLEASFTLVKGMNAVVGDGDAVDFELYHGEAKSLRVNIKNVGNVDAKDVTVKLIGSDYDKRLLSMGEPTEVFQYPALAVDDGFTFETPLDTSRSMVEGGAATLKCVTEHSSEFCPNLFRETKRTLRFITKNAMAVRDSEIVYVRNGEIAAVLGLENLTSMVLRIQAKQLTSDRDGKAGFDFEEVLVEPKGFASAVVRLDLQSTADNPRVLLRWDSLSTGSHGHLEVPLDSNDSPLITAPKVKMTLSIDESDHHCASVLSGVFHKLKLVGTHMDPNSDAVDGTLDVRICIENGTGKRRAVGIEKKVMVAGVLEGVRVSASNGFEHTIGARFGCVGTYGVEASLRARGHKVTRFWRVSVSSSE
eukprot:CAMPEP_0184751526 /NCGR_PEP_ID=MMETSP0315-20130426/43086_1 /TAXON_ID=101924 /ORGANISM="Rhodosorus marinus, Strain UTEX LB 2760" /LENGTH=1091 /DNA_ID=CAMNT_0027230787 /DNA_START=237 /DNA_END=3512 /DNA_ORIENTATION=+